MHKRLILFILSFMLLAGCAFEQPKAPQWDVNFNVPLMNKYYYVNELANGDHNIIAANDSMYLTSEGNIQGRDIGDSLVIRDNSTPFIPVPASGAISIKNEGSIEMAYGVVSRGFLSVEARDAQTGIMNDSISVLFNNIHMPDGQPLKIILKRSTDFNRIVNIDLTDARIGSLDNNQIMDSLRFTSQYYQGSSYASLVKISYTNIFMSSLKGNIFNKKINVQDDLTEINVNYPYDIEAALEIALAKITLNIENSIGFDCEFHGTLTAFNKNSLKSKSLNIVNHLNAAESEFQNTITDFTLDPDSAADLVNVFPTQVSLTNAYFIINNSHPEQLGFINAQNTIQGTYDVLIPFKLRVKSNKITAAEVENLAISPETGSQIEKKLEAYAEDDSVIIINMDIENKFPVAAEAEIFFCNYEDTSDVYYVSPDRPGLMRMKQTAADIAASPDGVVSALTNTQFVITKGQSRIFSQNPMVYYGFKFKFKDSGDYVTVYSNQYIRLTGRMTVQIHLGSN